MSEVITPGQLISMMLEMFSDLDECQKLLQQTLYEEAAAEEAYRKARWEAYQKVEGKTVDERNAEVDATTATARRERDSATGYAKAAMEAVRNRRQQLSALQSISNSVREEAALARVGPDLDGAEQDRMKTHKAFTSKPYTS